MRESVGERYNGLRTRDKRHEISEKWASERIRTRFLTLFKRVHIVAVEQVSTGSFASALVITGETVLPALCYISVLSALCYILSLCF